MIDTINLLFTEHLQQGFIQLLRRLQTCSERFFHHDPVPSTPFLYAKQTTSSNVFRDCLLGIWRSCQIIHHPHRNSIFLHQKHHPFPQFIGSLYRIKRLVVHLLQETINLLPVQSFFPFQLLQHQTDRQTELLITHGFP